MSDSTLADEVRSIARGHDLSPEYERDRERVASQVADLEKKYSYLQEVIDTIRHDLAATAPERRHGGMGGGLWVTNELASCPPGLRGYLERFLRMADRFSQ